MPSLAARSRVTHIPEMVPTSEVITSPYRDAILAAAAGSLLFPFPVFYSPVLSLSDVAPPCDHPRTLRWDTKRAWKHGAGRESAASGNGSGNEMTSCDGDSETRDNTLSPLDLSPRRCERTDSQRFIGINQRIYFATL